MISPPKRNARARAREDLPLPVGPAMTTSGERTTLIGRSQTLIAHRGLGAGKKEKSEASATTMDQAQDNQQSQCVGRFRLTIEKWHRGSFYAKVKA